MEAEGGTCAVVKLVEDGVARDGSGSGEEETNGSVLHDEKRTRGADHSSPPALPLMSPVLGRIRWSSTDNCTHKNRTVKYLYQVGPSLERNKWSWSGGLQDSSANNRRENFG